jgi:hypothetical protein
MLPLKTAMTTLTSERIEQACTIVRNAPYKVRFEQSDTLTDDMIQRYWDEKDETIFSPGHEPMDWLALEVDDWFWAGEEADGKPDWIRGLLEKANYSDEEIAILFRDHQIECSCLLEYDTEHFNTDVNVRFELFSRYDCQLSHFGSARTYTFGDTYFGDMCKALCLDPLTIQSPSLEVVVPKNKGCGTGNYAVDGAKLAAELVNNTSPSLLTILATIPFSDLRKRQFTVPEGSKVGMFSAFEGSGSLFRCELIRDFAINLNTGLGGDPYCHWGMVPDCYEKYNIVGTFGQWPGE